MRKGLQALLVLVVVVGVGSAWMHTENMPSKAGDVLGLTTGGGFENLLTRVTRIFTWQTYKSEGSAFKIRHPRGWTVTENTSESGRYISVTKSDDSAFVAIKAYKDETLKKDGALQQAIAQKEAELKSSSHFSIDRFDSGVEGTRSGYIAAGGVATANGQMKFEERGIYGAYGKAVLMHGSAKAELFDAEYSNLTGIMESFEVR